MRTPRRLRLGLRETAPPAQTRRHGRSNCVPRCGAARQTTTSAATAGVHSSTGASDESLPRLLIDEPNPVPSRAPAPHDTRPRTQRRQVRTRNREPNHTFPVMPTRIHAACRRATHHVDGVEPQEVTPLRFPGLADPSLIRFCARRLLSVPLQDTRLLAVTVDGIVPAVGSARRPHGFAVSRTPVSPSCGRFGPRPGTRSLTRAGEPLGRYRVRLVRWTPLGVR